MDAVDRVMCDTMDSLMVGARLTAQDVLVMQAEAQKSLRMLCNRTDFKTWQRETLEQFARQAADENAQLREDNKTLREAWRREVVVAARARIT